MASARIVGRYIQVRDTKVGFTKRDGERDGELPEAVQMVRALQGNRGALDAARDEDLALVKDGAPLRRPVPEGGVGDADLDGDANMEGDALS